ncbi:MAG TPA: methyltransferase [Lentisphaeria bacterium]|nr:MAG: hypothetical protein A2X48_00355 [Lentisphaerae bacterium GWF2_49_21]HBC88784.1 methyltransferase [Lentisphaeria bacterium]
MVREKGSYDFGGFKDKRRELEILERQSLAAIDLERSIWRNAGLEDGMKVLDLGCGPGFTSCEIARTARKGLVLGIDGSWELVLEAQKTARRRKLKNVSFIQGDACRLRLPDNSFDFVHARLLFQHLEHPGKALGNIRRILKPGGKVCITDIDDRWLKLHPEPRPLRKLLEGTYRIQKRAGGDRHVGGKLGGMLYDAGFSSISTGIHLLTSREIGLKGLLDIAIGFRAGLFPSHGKNEADAMIREIYSLLDKPEAGGWCGIFAAAGRKA